VNSILEQTYFNYEILVIDDGSTDDTELKIIGLDKRITYYKLHKTGNPSVLRNYGIEQSKGDFIAFCDDDDIWYSEKLEMQLKYIDKYNIICTNAELINSKGEQVNVNYCSDFDKDTELNTNHLFIRNYIITSTVLLNRKILTKNPFDVLRTKSMAEDFDLWLKLSLHNSVYYINKSLIGYRIHTTPSHKGENYFLLLVNGINVINKYKIMVPKQDRKYAVWGIIKLRKAYIKLNLMSYKFGSAFKELVKSLPVLFNFGFLSLLFSKLLFTEKAILLKIDKGK
jgi:glycosyltransferase involved in cell wall biosynthesis